MTKSPYTREEMSKRFAELSVEIARIESTSPRLERDRIFPTLNDTLKSEYNLTIKRHEEGLAELKTEYAFLAKALGGKTMSGQ